MTIIDSWLQQWRINKALRAISGRKIILDIGCHQGEMLIKIHNRIDLGIGIDPLCNTHSPYTNIQLFKGFFPEQVPGGQFFDAITALALVEHLPEGSHTDFFEACAAMLLPRGILVCTIPHPRVDALLGMLVKLRLVKGMSLEEHHGFDVGSAEALALAGGLQLKHLEKFQLGLNHLFVFEKKA